MIAIFLIQLLQHQIYLPEDLQIVNKIHSASYHKTVKMLLLSFLLLHLALLLPDVDCQEVSLVRPKIFSANR